MSSCRVYGKPHRKYAKQVIGHLRGLGATIRAIAFCSSGRSVAALTNGGKFSYVFIRKLRAHDTHGRCFVVYHSLQGLPAKLKWNFENDLSINSLLLH
jgi:hypothetical protein